MGLSGEFEHRGLSDNIGTTLKFEKCDSILLLCLKEKVLIFLETQTEVFLGEILGICFKIF